MLPIKLLLLLLVSRYNANGTCRRTGIFLLLFALAVVISQAFLLAPARPLGRHKLLPPPPTTTVANTLQLIQTRTTGLCSAVMTQNNDSNNNNNNIQILYETDRLLVIDKPAGIPHHTAVAGREQQLGILARIRHQQLDRNFPYRGRIYGVHRLDAVTSGILVLAKDAAAASELTATFRRSSSSSSSDNDDSDLVIKKYYTGISRHKASNKKQGWITGSMVRGRRKSWFLTRPKDKRMKKMTMTTTTTTTKKQQQSAFAKTRFFTAGLGDLQAHYHAATTSSTSHDISAPPKTLLFFRPYTGRTHQLRVAAKSVGLPLAGDAIYRDKFMSLSQQQQQHAATVDRTYLHATGLYIPPSSLTGKSGLAIWCPPPFEETLWDDKGQAKFREIFYRLVRKHCDCPELLQLLPVLPNTTTTTSAAATDAIP